MQLYTSTLSQAAPKKNQTRKAFGEDVVRGIHCVGNGRHHSLREVVAQRLLPLRIEPLDHAQLDYLSAEVSLWVDRHALRQMIEGSERVGIVSLRSPGDPPMGIERPDVGVEAIPCVVSRGPVVDRQRFHRRLLLEHPIDRFVRSP